jgi:hypothetical protein
VSSVRTSGRISVHRVPGISVATTSQQFANTHMSRYNCKRHYATFAHANTLKR